MKIIFIRHGKTQGNIEKKYIGSTDQPLCKSGIDELKGNDYPDCETVISSPMKRCIRTANIIYPNKEYVIENDLRECDFGDFENKDHNELSSDPHYQKWIESNAVLPFPNGESPAGFKKRCTEAFDRIMLRYKESASLAFVVHGGSIMAILEKYADIKKDFYSWHCENGHGYICVFNGEKLKVLENI